MSTRDDPRVSRTHWFIVGGRGPPPRRSAFLRMASERKASYRENFFRRRTPKEVDAKEAEAEAEDEDEENKEARAGAREQQQRQRGLFQLLKKGLGLEKRKDRLKRQDLLNMYGGKSRSLRKARAAAQGTVATTDNHNPPEAAARSGSLDHDPSEDAVPDSSHPVDRSDGNALSDQLSVGGSENGEATNDN